MANVKNNIMIENAKIGFRNFSGAAGKFNTEGRRNFCVFLETETARNLQEDGWNIRWLEPRDGEDDPKPYLQVSVRFENELSRQKMNPKIVLISQHGKTVLNESTVNILDWAEIDTVDLIIRPYNWNVSGKEGVKGYLKSMYATIVEDELESKYYDVPDKATDTIGGCGHCEECDGSCGHHEH
jgi:hypothetical protein